MPTGYMVCLGGKGLPPYDLVLVTYGFAAHAGGG